MFTWLLFLFDLLSICAVLVIVVWISIAGVFGTESTVAGFPIGTESACLVEGQLGLGGVELVELVGGEDTKFALPPLLLTSS